MVWKIVVSSVITRCYVVLLIVTLSVPSSCSTVHHNGTYFTTTPRSLTWAQLIQNKRILSKASGTSSNQIPPSTYSNGEREHNIPNQPHTERKDIVTTPELPSSNRSGQIDSTQLQKRALDFLYHKFVEPKIHKDLEPRPSLIEDLIATFDEHVMKDLRAWNIDSPTTRHENSASAKTSKENRQTTSSSRHDYEFLSKPNEPIASVAHVEEGEMDDTFLVTEESGKTHMITVDDIIGSLSQLNEETISDLLLSSPPIEPTIERMDTISYLGNNNKPYKIANLPDIADSVQYSRKGMDNNDVIIIENEDGDTRLITVKDLKTIENKNIKENKAIESKPVQVIPGHSQSANTGPNKNAIITLEDLLYLNPSEQPTKTHLDIFKSIQGDMFSLSPDRPQNIRTNDQIKLNLKENSKHNPTDPLHDIRQSLEKILQKQTNANLSNPPTPFRGLAPNSPPLKTGSTGSLTKFIPFQKTASIKPGDEPTTQKPGIRGRLSTFFSRLIGKPVKDVDVTRQSEDKGDQFVHLMIPNSGSNLMEELTIPLPKPIHFRGRKIFHPETPVQITSEKVPQKAQSRSFFVDSPSTKKRDKIRPKVKPGKTATVESILKTAKIPDSVQQKLLQQINERENENPDIPVLKNIEKASAGRKEIDRFFVVKNKSKQKKIRFPIGYSYDVSPEEYTNGYDPYATHDQYAYDFPHTEHTEFLEDPYTTHHFHTHDGPSEEYTNAYDSYTTSQVHPLPHHEEGEYHGSENKEPLVDFSLLADLVFLSKIGDSNKSFSFPKIGDSKRFVDTRKHYH